MPKRGPVVLVTGASQGIGAEIAVVFAGQLQGVRLALVARKAVGLSRTASACLRAGAASVEVFPADVSDAAQVTALSETVVRKFRRVDVLINNAGAYRPGALLETSVEAFDAAIAANLRSVFLMCRAFVPGMVKRGRGDVFNMSSIAGLKAYPGGAAYCAAKFGVTGLSQVLREELKKTGVRVCTVHPGATWSPSWSGSGVKRERLMPARDIAQAFFDAYRLSRRTVVEELVLRPQLGDL
jgi:NAD(P)-dependent dehydrogenase (short-subunit alcohol dehydrogenase family)